MCPVGTIAESTRRPESCAPSKSTSIRCPPVTGSGRETARPSGTRDSITRSVCRSSQGLFTSIFALTTLSTATSARASISSLAKSEDYPGLYLSPQAAVGLPLAGAGSPACWALLCPLRAGRRRTPLGARSQPLHTCCECPLSLCLSGCTMVARSAEIPSSGHWLYSLCLGHGLRFGHICGTNDESLGRREVGHPSCCSR